MTLHLFTEKNISSFKNRRQAILLSSMAWGKRIFAPLALVFIGTTIWNSRINLAALLTECSFYHISAAIFIWILLHFFAPYLFHIVLGACGSSVSYKKAMNIHISRLPAKYLPGGIWHTVARVSDLYDYEVKPRHLATLVFLENTLAVGVTFTFGGLILTCNTQDGIMKYFFLISAVCGVLLLFLNPILVNRFILKQTARLALPQYVVTMGIASLLWIAASTAFLFYFSGVMGAQNNESFIVLAGTYMFSWGVGFIAFFAPQGIGVFEAVAAYTMHSDQGFCKIVTVIAGYRLVILVADLTTWAGFHFFRQCYFRVRRN